MVWEALTNRRFWGGKAEMELIGSLMRGEFPPFPSDVEAPAELVAIATQATSPEPSDRFETANAMRAAIDAWLSANDAGSLEAFQPVLSKWFARERAQVGKLIEASATASGEGELPSLAPDPAGSQSLVSTMGPMSQSFSKSSPHTVSNTAQATPPTAVTSSQVIVVPASKAPWAVAAVALIALGGAGWALARKTAAPEATVTAAASARLTVENSPANAQIFIDDAAVTGNPFTASFPRGQSHTVRVTAPGFAPKAEHIELTDNVKLKISLDAAQAAEAPATSATATGPSGTKVVYLPSKPGAPATVAPTTAAPATATADPKAPLRNVDSSNPYATTGAAVRALASAVPAFADAPQKEAAMHFERGVTLYGEADYAGALVEFKRAYEIAPNPLVLYNIGQANFQLRNYATALEFLERYRDEAGAGAPHAAEVEQSISALKSRVGRLTVTANLAAEVTMDDESRGKAPLTGILVSVGRHKLVVKHAGSPTQERTVEIAAGDTRDEKFEFVEAKVVETPKIVPQKEEPKGLSPIATGAWIGAGALLAGAVTTGIVASGAGSSLDDERNSGSASRSRLDTLHSRMRTFAVTTDVLGAAAILAGGVAVYFTFIKPSSSSPAASVGVAPNGLQLKVVY
ncbi:hypothetical protein OUZ56_032380 [Daphnia magna]|uniref:PEGA domain-containing protein n=1 Tax=Daphnia magna TaxID=35525 RepID=A0ABR0B8R9_9CRUS|nr:hypothetical protein OUZ56_032380 [Daphnia magna]